MMNHSFPHPFPHRGGGGESDSPEEWARGLASVSVPKRLMVIGVRLHIYMGSFSAKPELQEILCPEWDAINKNWEIGILAG